ncbi:hypothetical protein NL487_28640, partial [Klebsiella pneumoniae]|nr:hypothetical protein [Klebsiella pneumoniae]
MRRPGLLPADIDAAPLDTTSTRDSSARPPRYISRAIQQTLVSNVVVNRANAWLFGADWARRVSF